MHLHKLHSFLFAVLLCSTVVAYAESSDLYSILGVPRTASTQSIQKRFRVIARTEHPDQFNDPSAKEKAKIVFQEITHAYEVLSNEKKRKEYDATGRVSNNEPTRLEERLPPLDWSHPSITTLGQLSLYEHLSTLDWGLCTIVLTYSDFTIESRNLHTVWEDHVRSSILVRTEVLRVRQVNVDDVPGAELPPSIVFGYQYGRMILPKNTSEPAGTVLTRLEKDIVRPAVLEMVSRVNSTKGWDTKISQLSRASKKYQFVAVLCDPYETGTDTEEAIALSIVLRSNHIVAHTILVTPKFLWERFPQHLGKHMNTSTTEFATLFFIPLAANVSNSTEQRVLFAILPQVRRIVIARVMQALNAMFSKLSLRAIDGVEEKEHRVTVESLVGVSSVERLCREGCALLILPQCVLLSTDTAGSDLQPVLSVVMDTHTSRVVQAFRSTTSPPLTKGYLCGNHNRDLIKMLNMTTSPKTEDVAVNPRLLVIPNGIQSQTITEYFPSTEEEFDGILEKMPTRALSFQTMAPLVSLLDRSPCREGWLSAFLVMIRSLPSKWVVPVITALVSKLLFPQTPKAPENVRALDSDAPAPAAPPKPLWKKIVQCLCVMIFVLFVIVSK